MPQYTPSTTIKTKKPTSKSHSLKKKKTKTFMESRDTRYTSVHKTLQSLWVESHVVVMPVIPALRRQ
jgi:hypothetical protein